ncbi:MAG TPA: TetR/AcrR family transcriptional regulator [Homoserinimonas sp.]|nr:TetR/AcrR family transcriptional regulator [Homoserinimonas sp.]
MITEADGRRRRGNASRQAVLDRAVNIASTAGLDGLSIGQLASELGASKSGVIALFGNKLDLQLATIRAARSVFISTVIEPALRVQRGLPRLWAICELWLDYSDARVFEGGCFFRAVSAEAGSKAGPVRDTLAEIDAEWIAFIERAATIAQPDLPRLQDVEQLAFEIVAIMDGANTASLLHRSSRYYELARGAIRDRLIALGADPSQLTRATAPAAAPATG